MYRDAEPVHFGSTRYAVKFAVSRASTNQSPRSGRYAEATQASKIPTGATDRSHQRAVLCESRVNSV